MRRTVLDIRTFLKTASYTGYTKKGIVIQKVHITSLIEKLQAAYDIIE